MGPVLHGTPRPPSVFQFLTSLSLGMCTVHVSRSVLLGPGCWRGWGTSPRHLGVVNWGGGSSLSREPALIGWKQPGALFVVGWLIQSFISVDWPMTCCFSDTGTHLLLTCATVAWLMASGVIWKGNNTPQHPVAEDTMSHISAPIHSEGRAQVSRDTRSGTLSHMLTRVKTSLFTTSKRMPS